MQALRLRVAGLSCKENAPTGISEAISIPAAVSLGSSYGVTFVGERRCVANFLAGTKKALLSGILSSFSAEGDSTAPYNLWSSEHLSVKGYMQGYSASPADDQLSVTMSHSTSLDPPRSVHLYGNLGKGQRN